MGERRIEIYNSHYAEQDRIGRMPEGDDIEWFRSRARKERQARLSEIFPVEKLKVKPTVILTSVSLMGQWEDEAKKHAPGLVVKVYHHSRKKKSCKEYISLTRGDISNLNKVDVIISTSTFKWPEESEFISITNLCSQGHANA
jgi:hypothetical protein